MREQGGCEPTRFHLKRKTAWVGDMPSADIELNTAVERRQQAHCLCFLRSMTCGCILSTVQYYLNGEFLEWWPGAALNISRSSESHVLLEYSVMRMRSAHEAHASRVDSGL